MMKNPGIALFALVLSTCCLSSATADQREKTQAEEGIRWLDQPHGALSVGVQMLSQRFDDFFDVTGEEKVGDTRVRITTGTEFREAESVRFTTGAGVRLDLPHFEQRWNLLLENIEISEETITEQDAGDDFSAGLRLLLRQTRRSLVNADAGLRFSDGPVLYGRLRFRRQYVRDPHFLRFTQFVHWRDRRGFGTTCRLEYEHKPAENYLVINRGNFEWGEKTAGVEWSYHTALARILRDRHGGAVFTEINGETSPNGKIKGYRTGIRYRYRLYREWLFLDLVPAMEFNYENNFKLEPVLTARLETIFGRI